MISLKKFCLCLLILLGFIYPFLATANSEPSLRFQLPYPKGQCYWILQGNNNYQGTHNDISNRYAWDFSMPKGTPISAAASGQVVLIKDGSDGKDKSIVIQHDRQYHSLYTHLSSVEVATNQMVKAGEQIGTGGWNREFASHIHYLVITRRVDGITAIPSRFVDVANDGIPKEDREYCARGGLEDSPIPTLAPATIEGVTKAQNRSYLDNLRQRWQSANTGGDPLTLSELKMLSNLTNKELEYVRNKGK
jgi:murein DD-endopeptidase MepM/ murein hydrolase activator NlpD